MKITHRTCISLLMFITVFLQSMESITITSQLFVTIITHLLIKYLKNQRLTQSFENQSFL